MKADIVGLRSDLLGPLMPESCPGCPTTRSWQNWCASIRFAVMSAACSARRCARLAETRLAMQRFRFGGGGGHDECLGACRSG